METRLLIGYALIVILVLGIFGAFAWAHYNKRDHKIARQRAREARSRMDADNR